MRHYGYRGSRRRSGPRPMIKTYKKIINFASASFSAGFQQEVIATGVDSIALGQTSAGDVNVPTGSRISGFEFQFAVSNVVLTPCFLNCSIQYVLNNQVAQDPDLLGGNPQRNQVLHQDLFTVGEGQNSTHKFKIKIPQKFQRIREGMSWLMVWSNSATVNRTTQIIYKVQD